LNETIWLGITTFFTLGIFSMLWKRNPWYHLIEHIAIGGGSAHLLIFAFVALQRTAIDQIQHGKLILIIPMIVGLLQLSRLSKQHGWLARYPMSILIGVGIGMMLAATVQGQLIAQIAGIGDSIINAKTPIQFWSFVIAGLGTLAGFTYFIFTREHEGILGYSARIGRIVLMAGFGVGWGCEVGWFLSSLVTRTEVVLNFIYAILGIPR